MAAAAAPLPSEVIEDVMKEKNGAFILVDCASGEIADIDPAASGKRLPPCSTFKIWNALLGIEEGFLTDAAEPFYQWDGVKHTIDAWNKDMSLRDAFQTSCVPAFQALARRIGPDRMNHWLDALDYGDKNTRAGIDVFWLPAADRATLLISPKEQAGLMCKLLRGELPVKPATLQLLKQLMEIRTTPKGTLYGKTGSGSSSDGKSNIGWFVGFSESGGKTFAFTACLQGKNLSGAEARTLSETILQRLELL
jgi:beta-lactamase class D